MKKYVIFICFILTVTISAFSETRKVTVKQYIRYSDGQYAELLSPQISKTKALKTNKGKVLVKYDFSIEKSAAYSDIRCAITVPNNIPISPTGIDGAFAPDDVEVEIIENNRIAPVVKWDKDTNAIMIIITAKKGTNAIIEFQLDVSDYPRDTIPINICFVPKKRSGFWNKAKRVIRFVGIVTEFKDHFSHEFENPFESSNRNYTLLVTE